MTRRSTEGAPETSVQRIARRAEEDRQENRAGFSAILESIETLRTEVRRGAQNTGLLEQRFNDLEFQVNLTRDEVQRRVSNPSQMANARSVISDAAKSPAGRLSMWLAIVVSTFVIAGNIDDMIRHAERFWAFLAGREVAAVNAPGREVPDN